MPLGGGVLTLGYYFLNITVNQVPLALLFDTGSSNLAFSAEAAAKIRASPVSFASAECAACSVTPGERCLFGDPERAAGQEDLCGMSISYGGGSSYIQGVLNKAHVEIDGLAVPNASVVAITRELPAGSFSAAPSDGIIGFASETNAINPTYAPTIWAQLASVHELPSVFGVCLNGSTGGVLTLGGVAESKFAQPLTWLPLAQRRWFNVDLLDVLVGSTSLGLPSFVFGYKNDAIGAFFDSGTSALLLGPLAFSTLVAVFQAQYKQLPGVADGTLFSGSQCISAAVMGASLSQFPDVTLQFRAESQQTWSTSVPPSSYFLSANNDNDNRQFCMAIAGVPGVGAVIGDVVMENLYIAHDLAGGRLGVAPITSC
jgi:hypothetical protein